jgi:hypothetical protein
MRPVVGFPRVRFVLALTLVVLAPQSVGAAQTPPALPQSVGATEPPSPPALSSAAGAGAGGTRAAAWDGLERLEALAAEHELGLVRVRSLALSKVTSRDALLIVGPKTHLPVSSLSAFLREGGRVALLDDFGSGGRFLAAYQVERSEAPRTGPSLRHDARLLLAYPRTEHPLAEGVPVLLTNESSALRHPDLKPVFVFGHSQQALALAGAVGAGRLVAIGDASLLINQLMELPAHQRFAKNLLEYLGRSSGRIWLLGPEAELVGSFGEGDRHGSAWLDAMLKRASHPDLPASVLALIAFSLAAIGAVIAVSALPRKSPYLRTTLFPDDSVYAGFAGRVALSRQAGSSLMWPLLDLKHELEAELRSALRLPGGSFEAEGALRAASAGGLPSDDCTALAGLLRRLSELGGMADDERAKSAVSAAELGKLETEARRLMNRVTERSGQGQQTT